MLNKNFLLILFGNVILGSSLPILIILGVFAGSWLAPKEWLSTAPPTVSMLAGIFIASPISNFMGRFGRRTGFLLGAIAMFTGASLAVFSLHIQSFALLCLAHFLLGSSLICVNYFRFAAAEAVNSDKRSQAISYTLASGLVAAIIGPELFTWSKDVLMPTPFAGAYAAIAMLGLLGVFPVLALSDIETAKSVCTQRKFLKVQQIVSTITGRPKVAVAIGVGALNQGVMVLLMTPTPLAMIGCGFAENQASDVIRWHVVAMFAPGFVTGSLIKRFGAERIAITGVGLILISAAIALSGLQLLNFFTALIILGVGWNFGFISGTYLVQSAVGEEEAPMVQGANETVLAIASAFASLLSGALYAGMGWIGLLAISIPVTVGFCTIIFHINKRVSNA